MSRNFFVERALEGNNILIDACIGSGKTTSIQYLCNEIPETKKILYLTYNKLLKIDAKARIKNKNATVTNYHGFACWILRKNGMIPSFQDSIQMFLNGHVRVPHYDVLIIDEYQDLEEELAKMILIVKQQNPGIQLIAVGDMCQKIYDKTTLDVAAFMDRFLGQHLSMSFTILRPLEAHSFRGGRNAAPFSFSKKYTGIL